MIVADNPVTREMVHMLTRLEHWDYLTPPEFGNSPPEAYINKLLRALDLLWD